MKRLMRFTLTLLFAVASTSSVLAQGAVTGTVKFTGTPPANPKIDMAEEPDCKSKHTTPPTDPLVVVNKGGLANVFISVKSGLPAGAKAAPPPTPAVLDQLGCLYNPRVFGIIAGQNNIQIKNSDGVAHNIKAVPKKNRGFNISQPIKDMKTLRSFPTPEPAIPLECSIHGWMHAKLFVMDNPYFAVSDANGAFSINGLPAGTYTLEAWHEKYGTKTATVTVTATGGTATFTFAAT